MAFNLGEAVVTFKQKGLSAVEKASGKAAGSLKRAGSAAQSLAARMSAVAAAAAGVGMIKLAVDAETTQAKFTALLKSGDAAADMMGRISAFAAQTPFQKMQIAGATQKLLAFGSSADIVLTQVKQIGDIAALTGIPLEELAEIYGKAQVQGRLFAEDINQLTGRGIPIIQELAKQFGVTEQEVKKLVENGEVGFENLQLAFAEMTTGTGQFAGGMETLAATTAGQFSTMVDNVKMLGESIGKFAIPLLNEIITSVTWVVQNWETLWDIAVKTFQLKMSNAWEHVKTFATNAWEAFKSLGTNLKSIFSAMGKGLRGDFAGAKEELQKALSLNFEAIAANVKETTPELEALWLDLGKKEQAARQKGHDDGADAFLKKAREDVRASQEANRKAREEAKAKQKRKPKTKRERELEDGGPTSGRFGFADFSGSIQQGVFEDKVTNLLGKIEQNTREEEDALQVARPGALLN